MSPFEPSMKVLAEGLAFPEGPIAMPDGSVLVVEIRRGTLTRVRPDGACEVVARLGGGPNGAAIGPDGACYVCNNGGFDWHDTPDGRSVPGLKPAHYQGGSIQRVDLHSGQVSVLYDRCGDHPLLGPNDIVFDADGGFWFTDLGKRSARSMDHGGVYYARADGGAIEEVIYPLNTPNGIGLSPDGKRLYVAETAPGRLWAFDVERPGRVRKGRAYPNGGELVVGLPGFQLFDSLAVQDDGQVCVATLFNGGISVVSPEVGLVRHIALPDPFTTNLCFGGPALSSAFITLSSTGRLVRLDWPTPGLPLNFSAAP